MKLKCKKILSLLLMTLTLSNLTLGYASISDPFSLTNDDIIAESAILIDQDTGQIIFEKNANVPMFPASTTKILTAIIILEDCDLNAQITIDDAVPFIDGSGIALDEGEVLTVEQLLYAMLLVSANDAAVALAKFHSGTTGAFAEVMNSRAASMGALNSNFINPNGLPNSEHISTAYDLAMIAKYAMQNEKFSEIITTTRYEIPANTVKTEARILNHTNKFLEGVPGSSGKIDVRGQTVTKGYDLIKGIKSGYTIAAQHCFVGAIEKDDRRFISAILKSQGNNMYIDTRNLLDYGIYSTSRYILNEKDTNVSTIVLDDSRKTAVGLNTETELSVDLPINSDISEVSKIILTHKDISLPIKKGERLGHISYQYKGVIVSESNLIADQDYSGVDLITTETTFYDDSNPTFFSKQSIISIVFKFIISLLLWRSIISIVRILKIKKPLKH